jgi:hypothetical protein
MSVGVMVLVTVAGAVVGATMEKVYPLSLKLVRVLSSIMPLLGVYKL